jgi:putative cell wall-binding protein
LSKPRTGAPRRVAVGLLAGALSLFGVAIAPPAGASASVDATKRLAGATRYGTAAAISADATLGTPVHAIIATGENFPDALAAASLAGANAPSPIILTETGTYSTDAKSALAALKTKGVKAVTIVGGTNAVTETVEDAIEADGFTVTRVAGDDRYETAAEIAKAANTKSAAAAVGGLKAALFATGTNFPDALAGGSAAYGNKLPILLVNDTVPASTQEAISSMGIKKAYILGGTAAVSTAVEGTLIALTGNPATRLAGTDRYATATAVGDFLKTTLAYPITTAILATGVNFPDALAAGPLAGANKAPLVLTASLPEASRAYLDANSSTINRIITVGGTTVVDDATVAAAKAAAQNVANDSAAKAVTTRPELIGAEVLNTVIDGAQTPTSPVGTRVRFTFDEALSSGFSPVLNNFRVYSSANTQYTATGGSATIEATATPANSTVLVNFPAVNTTALAGSLTKATVAFEAVRDATLAGNPEGEAPIGTAGTTTVPAGTTSAPDLLSVGGFRQATTANTTAVDFTFDANAFVATAGGFHLVGNDGVRYDCTSPNVGDNTTASGLNLPGGGGTTKITVTCANAGGGATLFSTSNVARGFIDDGNNGTTSQSSSVITSAAGGAGVGAPWQAADVAGSSLSPDLVSVVASATANHVIFTFDQTIQNATAARFRVYKSDGTSQVGTAAVVNTSNRTQVDIDFGASVVGIVGGYIVNTTNTVAGAAVDATDGSWNRVDEEGVAAGTSSTVTPGRTSGSDLTSVALSAITNAFGTTTGYQALYTFDGPASTTLTVGGAALFHLYTSDGTRYSGSTCTAGTGAAGSTAQGTVLCTVYTPTPAAATTLQGAVLGTTEFGAVTSSPEGAIATTGGTGTPAS